MQFFEGNGKFNWVDENNVFLGYDSTQSCCETANWFLADKITTHIPEPIEASQKLDWQNWYFEIDFFHTEPAFDGGGIAIFKIISIGNFEKYLHIFNHHNGFYGHGFEMKNAHGSFYRNSL